MISVNKHLECCEHCKKTQYEVKLNICTKPGSLKEEDRKLLCDVCRNKLGYIYFDDAFFSGSLDI